MTFQEVCRRKKASDMKAVMVFGSTSKDGCEIRLIIFNVNPMKLIETVNFLVFQYKLMCTK